MPTFSTDTRVTAWQIFILFLSVYVIVALAAETVFSLDAETSTVLFYIDTFVCLIFLADFAFNLLRAPDKRSYLKWGWIDLVSSIPAVQVLRWGRIARVVRIVRVLRTLRSVRVIFHQLFANRTKGAFTTVGITTFLLVVFSSIAILNVEVGPDANIATAEEALWWSLNTVTTVGYGDFYPTTTLGRLIAVMLMTAGVGLFGTFTAYVASSFHAQTEHENEHAQREQSEPSRERDVKVDAKILAELQHLRTEVSRLEQRLTKSE